MTLIAITVDILCAFILPLRTIQMNDPCLTQVFAYVCQVKQSAAVVAYYIS